MGKSLGISHDKIYRFLTSHEIFLRLFPDLLIKYAESCSKQKSGWLILDDTGISKRHAKVIEGLTRYYDSSENRSSYGISLVVLAWSNGDVTIPIGHRAWVHKEIMQEHYKNKKELAQELILEAVNSELPFQYAVLDGLYCSKDMINFFQQNKIEFEMKIHSNRSVEVGGEKSQLKVHPKIRLRKNEHSRTVKGCWYGNNLYFTIAKRRHKNKNTYNIIYQVSNMKRSSRKHFEIYAQR